MSRPLSFVDLAFFVLETAERPMNVGPLMVLRPPQGRGRRNFAARLTRRMLERPAGFPFDHRLADLSLTSRPALVRDENFDLTSHVHRVTLPKPGRFDTLMEMVCELHPPRLDRSRPLWDFYVIDGLENGDVAIYAKMHHGTVDGAGFARIIARWLSGTPDDADVRAMWEGAGDSPRQRGNSPSDLQHSPEGRGGETAPAQQLGRLVQSGMDAARSALSLSRLLVRQTRDTLAGGNGTTLPFVATPEVMDATPSTGRSLACCTLPLARLKALGKTRNATINDMLLTVLDMAMRTYLARMGRTPPTPLIADMAVAVGKGGSGGNQITMVQLALGRPEDGPVARLDEIRSRTRQIKGQIHGGMADAFLLHAIVSHGLPSLWEGIGWTRAPSLANMVVSNPFGFAEKRYLMGAEVTTVLPVSVVAPGQVLNVTAVNYCDDFQIAFLATAEGLPDIERLAQDTEHAFELLAERLEKLAASRDPVEAMETPHAVVGARTSSGRKPKAKPAEHGEKPVALPKGKRAKAQAATPAARAKKRRPPGSGAH